ncbi:MAG: ribosome biogenesis GTPase YlqF [Candidatus Sericytochromatia bacterium]|nr:ribosome biogenesis GTPase YlqF [Candidatus Sericytochromatia bacterium]
MSLINWYPGHIAKAQSTLRERLKLIDFVLELVDARLPASSRFDVTHQLLGEKPRLLVLTKVDLADPSRTQAWLQHYKREGLSVVVLNAQTGQGLAPLHAQMGAEAAKIDARMRQRGRLPRASRVMVVGLPNVGKSSLINRLARKRAAQVGDKPGVTRDVRWIRLGKSLELLDTPGIIPPKLEDQVLALKLAMVGSVSNESYDPALVAAEAIAMLQRLAPSLLADWTDPTIEGYARKRSIIGSGGASDLGRAARMFLQDLRTGQLGAFTLDELVRVGGRPDPSSTEPPPEGLEPALDTLAAGDGRDEV